MYGDMKKHLSLREVGRLLEIPPSTVVYYRDRFSKYIPAEESPSGRLLYPHTSLEIFRTIRQCYRDKWNKDQTEAVLAEKFPMVRQNRIAGGDAGNLTAANAWFDPQMVDNLNAALNRLASALTRQEEVFDQLRRIELEIETLKQEGLKSEENHRRQIDQLAKVIDQLKANKESSREKGADHFQGVGKEPDKDILCQPLTVHYPPDRYLGLKDQSGVSLSLDQLIQIIRANAVGSKMATLSWRQHRDAWILTASLKTPLNQKEQTICMRVRAIRTPKGNKVTEVVDMDVADQRLSKDELLKFFKLLKTGMSGFDDA